MASGVIPNARDFTSGRRDLACRTTELRKDSLPQNHKLADRLSRSNEINLTVTGRKSGRTITNPVWFVFDDKLYLLPVKGSDTQWYKNVLANPKIKIDARVAEADLKAVAVTDPEQVSSVVEKFRAKYAGDVKKYYSKFDVAVVIDVN